MKMNYLWIYECLGSGLVQVAWLDACEVKNGVKRGANTVILRLIGVKNSGCFELEWGLLWEKRWGIMKVHKIEYPFQKVKKANSLHVIMQN